MRFKLLRGLILLLITAELASGQQALTGKIALAFEGNRVFSEQELLGFTDKCLAADPRWKDRYRREMLDYCLNRLKLHLATRGYWQAKVGEFREQEVENVLRVIVPIEEGVLYRLGEIKIRGSKVFSAATILEMLALKTGDIADGERISKWLYGPVRKAYNDLGYIEYQAEPQVVFRRNSEAQNGEVDITVEVDEGNPFTIGLIKFEGRGTISEHQLRRDLLVQSKEIFNKGLFEQSLKIISENYPFHVIDPDKDVHYRLHDEVPRVDITIHLRMRPALPQK